MVRGDYRLMYNENGYLIVNECDCCDHFEPDSEVLVPMRECWCCKWSGFRSDVHPPESCTSICNYLGNAYSSVCSKETVNG